MNQGRWKKVSGAMRRVLKRWAPPPRLTVSEWADRYRRLSPEASAEPGPWVTARAPYQREIMDAACDPRIETVCIMSSAQVGKTEIINNIVGYHIDQDPCPMLVIQPILDIAKSWSKDRLAPMLRDTPNLKGKVKDVKSRNSDNEILHKRFPGGHITVGGANSAASLASRPVRLVLFDEVDRYPVSAGTEGDPVSLGRKRAVTFHNRKYVEVSTPTLDEYSRIQKSYEASDQRRYEVPCPHCGGGHFLEWANVVWESDGETGEHSPETAAHACPRCGALEMDHDLPGMLAKGRWVKGRPEVTGRAGFHLNELYSPWRKFAETVGDFLEAKGDPERLRVWVNTALGDVWRESKAVSTVDALLERRENYDADLVPMGGVIITVGVDVQDDRIELETVAFGEGKESWSLESPVFRGDPSQDGVWDALDAYLLKTFPHESGLKLRIMGCGIDTGGHHTSKVYEFCKSRWGRHVYALKGDGGQGKPVAFRPSKSNSGKVNLYRVGVDTVKSLLAAQLSREEAGPGYCHFPAAYGREHFEQLLAERPKVVMIKGQRTLVWRKKSEGARNEALDCRVYACAALEIMGVDVNATVEWFRKRVKAPEAPQPVKSGRRYRSRGVAA